MALCWPLQMPPDPKLLLMALADMADEDGGCSTRDNALARWSAMTCQSVETITRALCYLQIAGALRGDLQRRLVIVEPAHFDGDKPPAWDRLCGLEFAGWPV